jgi:hypothetical protein
MLFMVIERFPQHDMLPVYQRVRDGGRALRALLQQWALEWRDYDIEFEFVPVVTSAETRNVVAPFLGEG